MPGRALPAVRGWWFDPQPIHALVVARILFGLSLFGTYLVRFPDRQALYGPRGILSGELFPMALHVPNQWEAFGRWLGPGLIGAGLLEVLYAALLAASFCFAIGLRTRTAGWIALGLHVFFVRGLNPYSYWGWATYIQPLMVYVLLAPVGKFVSFDAWLAGRAPGSMPAPAASWVAPAWPLRLLQIHVCTMYTVSGASRLDDLGWLHGEAVYNAVVNSTHSRFLFDWRPLSPLLSLMTWVGLVLEPPAIVLLWIPRVGTVWAYLLIGMHAGLEVLTNVGWWGVVMTAGLLTFVPTAHLTWLLQHLPGGPPADHSASG